METLAERTVGPGHSFLVAPGPTVQTVTIQLFGGPLHGQTRLVVPQPRYITQTIEHNDTEWWEIIYTYRPVPAGSSTFYLAGVEMLHCDDYRN